MRIEMMPTVSFDDIQNQFGFGFDDVSFTNEVENGSYAGFALDEDAIDERKEEMRDMLEYGDINHHRFARLKNELTLINYFRELGYTDEILIWICW